MRNNWANDTRVRRRKTARRKMVVKSRRSAIFVENLEDRCMMHGLPLEFEAHPLFAPGTPTDVVAAHESHSPFQFDPADRWSSTATNAGPLSQGDPTVITFGIVPDGTPIPSLFGEAATQSSFIAFMDATYGGGAGPLNQRPWFTLVEQAIGIWGAETGLTFVYEPADDGVQLDSANAGILGTRADIRLSGHSIDGPSQILAAAFFPDYGDVVFDTDDGDFFDDPTNNFRNFRATTSHEIGHALGLNHVGPENGTKLMEAFFSDTFDTPEFDDILAANRGYGDKFEGNDTTASATDLGERGTGIVRAQNASIDDNSDLDVYKFTITSPKTFTASVIPVGTTYLSGPQGTAGTPFNAQAQSDLSIQVLSSTGTVLATANVNGIGFGESAAGVVLATAGTYYVRVAGAQDAVQMYDMTLTLAEGPSSSGISGVKWNDLDRDGRRDSNEPGLAGFTIFLDNNGNGLRDSGEPSTVTASNGSYQFSNLPGGTYRIGEVQQTGWKQSFPSTNNGFHTVTLAAQGLVSGINFGNYSVAQISGVKFNDLNRNGKQDANEPGIPGFYIYLDLDKNGTIGAGEPAAITNSNGKYTIVDVPTGSISVREVLAPGWTPTYPAPTTSASGILVPSSQTVSVSAGQIITGVNFGNVGAVDYGDAPASYKTNVAGKAASHGVVSSFRLGRTVDGESNGVPSTDAQGDNIGGVNDEDGVLFISKIKAGRVATVQVNASTSVGYLQAWIDFNGDGDWKDAGEQIFKDRLLSLGDNILTFTVPADAVQGVTYARFRYGVERGISHTGPAKLGEVEDYQISIPQAADNGVVALGDRFTVIEDSSNNSLNVLANDFERNGAPLTIISVGPTSDGGSVSIVNGTSLSYTPAGDFFGEESFTYTVSTSDGRQKTALVFVDVTGVNDSPIALNDDFIATQGNLTNLDVLANDSDVDGDSLSIISVGATDNGGSVTIAPDGRSLNYTSAGNFIGDETFTYTISDGHGGTATASVSVNVIIEPIDPIIEYELVLTDTTVGRNPISDITVGQQFVLQVYANDIRTQTETGQAGGVFSAYLDVAFSDLLVAAVPGSLTFPGVFNDASRGSIGDSPDDSDLIANEIDEVGATREDFDGTTVPSRELLFEITFTALAPGSAVFASNEAEVESLESTVFDSPIFNNSFDLRPVPGAILFGQDQINIAALSQVAPQPMIAASSGGQTLAKSATTQSSGSGTQVDIAGTSLVSANVVLPLASPAMAANVSASPIASSLSFQVIPDTAIGKVGLSQGGPHASLKDSLFSSPRLMGPVLFTGSRDTLLQTSGLQQSVADEVAQDEVYRELGSDAAAGSLAHDAGSSLAEIWRDLQDSRTKKNSQPQLEPVLAAIAGEVRIAWES